MSPYIDWSGAVSRAAKTLLISPAMAAEWLVRNLGKHNRYLATDLDAALRTEARRGRNIAMRLTAPQYAPSIPIEPLVEDDEMDVGFGY